MRNQYRLNATLVHPPHSLISSKMMVSFPIEIINFFKKTYVVEQTFCFSEVYYVDSNLSLKTIFHPKHEPLKLTAAVSIIPHPNIENFWLSLANLL
jgi:hypothetical protein